MPELPVAARSLVRSGGDHVVRYFSPAVVTVKLAARIAAAPLVDSYTGGIHAIPFDDVTDGDPLDVEQEHMLLIGTTAGGDDVGVMRIRQPYSTGPDRLHVGEVAPGEVKKPLAVGQYLTVTSVRRPALRRPRLEPVYDGDIIVDFVEKWDYDDIYVDQNIDIVPKANISEGLSGDETAFLPVRPAGLCDEGETYRTMTLTSIASRAFDSTIVGVLWDVGMATIVSGDENSETIIVQVPAGYHEFKLTVTASNSTNHTMYQPIWACDPTQPSTMPLTNFRVTRDDADANPWREMALLFEGDANSIDRLVYGKGAPGCYWEVATFADGAVSDVDDGLWYRGQMLGWLTESAAKLQKYNGSYEIHIAGIGWWLNSFFNGPWELIDTGEPASRFYEMQGIYLDKVVRWNADGYSNALSLVNFYFTGETNRTMGVEFGEGTLWEQLADVQLQNVWSVMGCDSLSAIWCRREYVGLTDVERLARPVVYGLIPADLPYDSPITLTKRETDKVGVTGMGGETVIDGVSYDLGAEAPGLSLPSVPGRQEASYQRVPSVNAAPVLLHLTARWHGRSNNPYADFDIELLNNFDAVEPAWNEPITATIQFEHPNGGEAQLVEAELMVRGVRVEHAQEPDAELPKRIIHSVEMVSSGQGAMLVPDIENPHGDPPEEVIETTPISGFTKAGVKTGWGFFDANIDGDVLRFIWTEDPDADEPVWGADTLTLDEDDTLIALSAHVDLGSPKMQGTGTQVDAILATGGRIYTLEDCYNDQDFTVRHTWATEYDPLVVPFIPREVVAAPSNANYLYVISRYIGGSFDPVGVSVIQSQDRGRSWGAEHFLPGYASGSVYPTVFVSRRVATRLFAIIPDATTQIPAPFKSDNGGASWVPVSNVELADELLGPNSNLYIPYRGNSNEDDWYYQALVTAAEECDPPEYRTHFFHEDDDLTAAEDDVCDSTLISLITGSPLSSTRLFVLADRGDGEKLYVVSADGSTWTERHPSSGLLGPITPFDDDASSFLFGLQSTNDLGFTYKSHDGNVASLVPYRRSRMIPG